MTNVFIREPKIEDKEAFISAMQDSQSLHDMPFYEVLRDKKGQY